MKLSLANIPVDLAQAYEDAYYRMEYDTLTMRCRQTMKLIERIGKLEAEAQKKPWRTIPSQQDL
jgi:hypothetical protein